MVFGSWYCFPLSSFLPSSFFVGKAREAPQQQQPAATRWLKAFLLLQSKVSCFFFSFWVLSSWKMFGCWSVVKFCFYVACSDLLVSALSYVILVELELFDVYCLDTSYLFRSVMYGWCRWAKNELSGLLFTFFLQDISGFLSDWGMFVWIHCDRCYFFVAWANDLACVNFFMSICLNFEHFWYIIIWLNLVCSVILNNVRNFFIERQSPLLFLSINILNYFRFEWFSLFLVLLSCSKFIKFFFTVPQLWTYGLILLSLG